MGKRLKNRIIIVTGGNGLIGKAIVDEIILEGGFCVNFDINQDTTNDLSNVYCDITNEDSIRNAISLVIEGSEVLGVWAEPIGLPETETYEDGLIEIIEEQVENSLLKSKSKLLKDDQEVEKLVSKIVSNVCKNEVGKKPVTRILINRIEN